MLKDTHVVLSTLRFLCSSFASALYLRLSASLSFFALTLLSCASQPIPTNSPLADLAAASSGSIPLATARSSRQCTRQARVSHRPAAMAAQGFGTEWTHLGGVRGLSGGEPGALVVLDGPASLPFVAAVSLLLLLMRSSLPPTSDDSGMRRITGWAMNGGRVR